MFLISFITGNRQRIKLSAGIASFPIVSRQHLRSHGFTESPGTADTDVTLFCIDNRICVRDQTAFVSEFGKERKEHWKDRANSEEEEN